MPPAHFDEEVYWSTRLEKAFSLDGVGWHGLGEGFNSWTYKVRRRLFARAVGASLTDAQNAVVLDVGSGTGFYVRLWHELGSRPVLGSDLTGVAVERLRSRYPDDRFVQLDITGELDGVECGSFDVVSAMDVLFHIVDDGRYARAVKNLAGLLRPGGLLVFSENLIHGAWHRGEHQVSRGIDWIEAQLDDAGLEMVSRQPMFVLMNTPVDSRARWLQRWWRWLTSGLHRWPRLSSLAGAVLYPIELLLTRLVREGPSTELVVCRKRPIGPGKSP
jgi:SAM-dependent methyltransferase